MIQYVVESSVVRGAGAAYTQYSLGSLKFATDMSSVGNYMRRLALYASGDIPAASDVRAGTAVDNTVGTLVVPAAGNVKNGVVFDNGTVGTLVSGGIGRIGFNGGFGG